MSGTSWESLISMVDPLIYEGYSIVIEQGEPEEDFTPYLVKVMDGDRLVASGRSGYLTEALADAFGATPEREAR